MTCRVYKFRRHVLAAGRLSLRVELFSVELERYFVKAPSPEYTSVSIDKTRTNYGPTEQTKKSKRLWM